MASRNALVQFETALPERIDLPPGAISGVDAVLPYLLKLYNEDEEARKEMSSFCKANSQNGAVWCDKARIVAKVRTLATDDGDNPVVAGANDALLSGWCSWGARRLDGIARSKRLAQAKANMLAHSRPAPSSTPGE